MKNFKKLAALTLSAVFCLGMLTACGNKDDQNAGSGLETLEKGKLIRSTNSDFPPYCILADDGSFEGIDYDLAAKLGKKLGLELVIDDMGFDAALLAVQNGQSDVAMGGISVNEERKAVMDFTDTYATGVQVVIVKEGSSVTMDNLGDHMIGTQIGTTGYLYASDTPENGGYGEDHVIGYEGGAMAVQALINGTVDAVIIDDLPAKEYVAANPTAGLTILEGAWVEEDYAIGVKKGNTAMLEALNKALKELQEDGTVQAIMDQYIKAD